jgi:hypothetical protein
VGGFARGEEVTWGGALKATLLGGAMGALTFGVFAAAGAAVRFIGRVTARAGKALLSAGRVALEGLSVFANRAYQIGAYASDVGLKRLAGFGINDVFLVTPRGIVAAFDAIRKGTKLYRLLKHADRVYQRALRYWSSRGITDPAELGIRAGESAERSLARWAGKEGLPNVRVSDVAIDVGEYSADLKWSAGKMIGDFKKSIATMRSSAEQRAAFKIFASRSGYRIFYIVGD